jgi:2-dehydropantoate 2-reductase
MKILCIGAGAIGLLAGGSAAAQGADVTFLVKPGQEDKLSGKEIVIQNQAQVWRVKDFKVVSSLTDLTPSEKFDFIFIAVKAFDTDSVIQQLKKGKVNFHAILCLQNGVENEDKFQEAFPQAVIVGASVVSAVSRLDDTSIRVEKNRGIGLSGNEAVVRRIYAILKDAGLRPQIFTDMPAMKWSKMLSNLFANATAGILDMSPNEIYSHKDLFRIEKAEILETVAVMRQAGLKINDLPGLPLRALIFVMRILPNGLLQPFLKKMVAGGRGEKMPSFYIEKMKGGLRSEVNNLNGAVVRSGEVLGVPTPVNRVLTDTFNLILQDAKARQAYSRNPEKLVETMRIAKRI